MLSQTIARRRIRYLSLVAWITLVCVSCGEGPAIGETQTRATVTTDSNCRPVALATPKPAWRKLPGGVYKGHPHVSFKVTESGAVADPRLIRSSGITAIDERVLTAVAGWEYQPQPGCGDRDVQVTVMINVH